MEATFDESPIQPSCNCNPCTLHNVLEVQSWVLRFEHMRATLQRSISARIRMSIMESVKHSIQNKSKCVSEMCRNSAIDVNCGLLNSKGK